MTSHDLTTPTDRLSPRSPAISRNLPRSPAISRDLTDLPFPPPPPPPPPTRMTNSHQNDLFTLLYFHHQLTQLHHTDTWFCSREASTTPHIFSSLSPGRAISHLARPRTVLCKCFLKSSQVMFLFHSPPPPSLRTDPPMPTAFTPPLKLHIPSTPLLPHHHLEKNHFRPDPCSTPRREPVPEDPNFREFLRSATTTFTTLDHHHSRFHP